MKRSASKLSWVLKPFSPFLRDEIEKRISDIQDKLYRLNPTIPHDDDSFKSVLPQQLTYIPGRILYIEKCRLWNDDKDVDLPWTYSRYSIGQLYQLQKPQPLAHRNRVSIFKEDDLEAQLDTSNDAYMDSFGSNNMSNTIHGSSSRKTSVQLPKILHGKYAYTPRWASREEFQEIIVSKSCFSDHLNFPFMCMKELTKVPSGRKLRIIKKS
jgi:hypothetical protein